MTAARGTAIAADTMPRFLPSSNGFAFINSWPSEPAVSVPTPFGPIDIGNAQGGLCGGMVFAALDYWSAQVATPAVQPPAGSPLYKFLVRRLIDSWNIPVGVAQYFSWMNLPDGDTTVDILGRHVTIERGLSSRTITQQWPQIKADLDAGMASPLGIVTVHSAAPSDLALNHQVLACSYCADGAHVTLQVYDPNSGSLDDVAIQFNTDNPEEPTVFEHNLNLNHPVRGFFRGRYSPAPPPAA